MNNYLISTDTDKKKLARPLQWDKHTKNWKSKWDVIEFIPYQYTKENIDKVYSLVKNNLSNDLLTDKYKLVKDNPMYGHCTHASQAIFWLVDTAYFIPMRGQDITGEYHWWLLDTHTNQIIDATSDQFNMFDYSPPYENGKKTPWHTWKQIPKKQTLDLIQKILQPCVRYNVADPYTDYATLEPFL